MVWFGGDDQNGPKRRRTRRLGHMHVFFLVFRVFFVYSNLYFISYLGSIDFINEGESWFGLRRRKRAKTT